MAPVMKWMAEFHPNVVHMLYVDDRTLRAKSWLELLEALQSWESFGDITGLVSNKAKEQIWAMTQDAHTDVERLGTDVAPYGFVLGAPLSRFCKGLVPEDDRRHADAGGLASALSGWATSLRRSCALNW